jgi:hypothetical protein
MYWIIFPCGTPVIVGLTLDYDLFLLTRVLEIRKRGVGVVLQREKNNRVKILDPV